MDEDAGQQGTEQNRRRLLVHLRFCYDGLSSPVIIYSRRSLSENSECRISLEIPLETYLELLSWLI